MTKQVQNGKAFERALANALSAQLDIPIRGDSLVRDEPESSGVSTSSTRFESAAALSVNHICNRERNNLQRIEAEFIKYSSDAAGQKGDVRDVIVVGKHGELGFSCKSNHAAYKHQRLSGRINFIKKWGIAPEGCSEEYWAKVRPLFQELADIKRQSDGLATWESLTDKPQRFYWPVLEAFAKELERVIASSNPSSAIACAQLVRYIIGVQDFYKVICRPNRVELLAFNHGGSLEGKTTKYPDHLYKIDTKNGGQYSKTVVLNHGYSFNFRIHNKSKRVEPSLAFDVQAIGLPPEIYTHTISF
jgi:hypothetical protein